MESKSWYLSKTIWGAIVMLLATVLRGMGVLDLTPEEQDKATEMVYNSAFAVSELVGFALVLWGRITAKTTIGKK